MKFKSQKEIDWTTIQMMRAAAAKLVQTQRGTQKECHEGHTRVAPQQNA